jgi:hypothetical protein
MIEKEPKRLLDQGATDFERHLLAAVMNERPSPAHRARMQHGLGLTGPLVWGSNVRAMLGDVSNLGIAAKLGLGAAAGGIVAALGITALINWAPATPAPEPEMVREAVVESASAPRVTAPSSEPSRIADSARIEPGAAAPQPTGLAGSEENSALREEIALLDEARRALQRGAMSRASSILEDYRRRFPQGVLSQEAGVLEKRTASPNRAPF